MRILKFPDHETLPGGLQEKKYTSDGETVVGLEWVRLECDHIISRYKLIQRQLSATLRMQLQLRESVRQFCTCI